MRYVEDWNAFNLAEDVLNGVGRTLKLEWKAGVFSLVCEWDCPLRPVRAIMASWADGPVAKLRSPFDLIRELRARNQQQRKSQQP